MNIFCCVCVLPFGFLFDFQSVFYLQRTKQKYPTRIYIDRVAISDISTVLTILLYVFDVKCVI